MIYKNNIISIYIYSFIVCIISIIILLYDIPDFSILSISILYVSGLAATYYAYYKGLIFNFNRWIYALTIYLIFSIVLFIWFWYIPLVNLGDLRTPNQIANYQDANFYDYLAYSIHDQNFNNWHEGLNATWLSQGVVGYLALIYRYIGTSQFNFLFINILIGYVAIIFLQGIVSKSGVDIAIPTLFLPFVDYYNITPGKEVLTNFFMFGALYFFKAYINNEFRNKNFNIIILIGFITILGFIRLNAMIMLIISLGLYTFLVSNKKFQLMIAYIIVILAVYIIYLLNYSEALTSILSLSSHINNLEVRISNLEVDSLKYKISIILINENPFIHLLLSPFRLPIWLYAPFPYFEFWDILSAIFSTDYFLLFRQGEAITRLLSSMYLVYLSCLIIYYTRLRFSKISHSIDSYSFFIFITFSIFLSSTQFIEGGRYRALVEPIMVLSILYIINAFKQNRKNF